MTAIAMTSLLIECIENMSNSAIFKQRTKNLANKFLKELEEIYTKFWNLTELKDREDAQLSLFAIEENFQHLIRDIIYLNKDQQQAVGFIMCNPDIAKEIVEKYNITGHSIDLRNP